MDAGVAEAILWIRAFPDLVALGSTKSMELGDVKMCLYTYRISVGLYEQR
jgi:hypothetical protein